MISLISAFGISSPYWQGNPLTMEKGEAKTIDLNLQNMVGEEDITVKAEITQGADIAFLEQDTFFIKAGTSDTIIPLKITIPSNIKEDNKTIKIDFKKISNDKGGVVIGTGMSVYLDITTKEDSKKSNYLLIILGAALIIILIIIIRKKKK